MAHVQGLRCRECGREYEVAPIYTCEWCFGPLEVAYDYDAITKAISREKIAAGPRTIWRYADLLPVDRGNAVDLGAGLHTARARRSARDRARARRAVDQERHSQSHELVQGPRRRRSRCRRRSSSASRPLRARRRAISRTPSPRTLRTRGCAASCSSRQPRSGQDRRHRGVRRQRGRGRRQLRRRQPALCGAGRHVSMGVRQRQRAAVLRGRLEDLGFETAEQLDWQTPDHVVVPVASGSLLTKIRKGFHELHTVGLLDAEPQVRVSGAQATGCSPVATAWIERHRHDQAGEAGHDRQVARDR